MPSAGASYPLPPTGHITAAQMGLVFEVSRMLAVTAELDPLLQHMAGAITELLDCERASIFLHDPKSDELWTKVALGVQREIRIPAGAGIVGHAFRTAAPLHVSKPYEDSRFNPEPDRASGFVTRNLLACPMLDISRKAVGVVQAVNKRGAGDFDVSDGAMLQLLADQAGVALQRYHLQQSAVRSMALEREMQLAVAVQEAMTPLPEAVPTVHGLRAAGWTLPASINGGDCYDLWTLPDGRLGILLADASGHGLGAALVVSQLRTLVRALCETEPDPITMIRRINKRLHEDLPSGRFVTAFVGYLDPSGALSWCSAGHGPILIRRCEDGQLVELEASVPPVGVLPEMDNDGCPDPVQLEPGDWLLIASDGITEAMGPGRELFGFPRLVETFKAQPSSAEPSEVIENIHGAVRNWQTDDEPDDDQTIVCVRRYGL